MQSSRILIIGAGISGIASGAKLIENGFRNLVILEAENRIGGRVHTIPFASNVLDMGAQWCHGEKNNLVYELVKDQKVLEESAISYPNVNFVSSAGQRLDDETCGRLMALCLSILENSEKDLSSFKGSLGSYVVAKYAEALRSEDFEGIDSSLAYQVLDYFHKFENSIEASDNWFETSGNGYLHYWECEGHPLLNWKDKGYKSVIDFITKKHLGADRAIDVESKILLNKEVCNVEWSSPRSHIVVKCSDGSSYDCDHVICTTSLGVLKENYETMFTPQLPALKVNAIKGLSIGVVDKIYLEFAQPFWGCEWAGFSLLWTNKDSAEIRGSSNAWLEDIFGFYKVDHQPNVLCGWIGGTAAREMEKLDDEAVMKGCLYLFEKFLGKLMPWTKPVNMKRSCWFSNKHFRGSYSFRSLTTDMLKTSANDLSHPLYDVLGKPSLMFAGEATSEHYYSTVHGALEAGWREAERLIDFYASSRSTNLPTEASHYDAIILGAGIAGLGAGTVLEKAKLNYLILEGSDRVGGRINTVWLENSQGNSEKVYVDAGAQWLHGSENDLFRFAESFGLIRSELSEEAEGDYIQENGDKIDEFFVKKVDFKFGQILEECEELVGRKTDENFKFPSSIEDFAKEKIESFVDALETNEERQQARQLLDWHRRFQIIDNSCLRFSDISAKDWGNYSFNGESCQTHSNVKEGMSSVVNQLHQLLRNRIKLNQAVEQIIWKGADCLVGSSKIKVRTRDGSVFTTNNLICTFSLGVLQHGHLKMFSPPLPKAHREVLENVGFGTINKIFLHFDRKWWDDDWKGLQILWSEDFNDDSHWTKFISGFDVVYPGPKNTLLGWIGGKGALEMEKLTDTEIEAECMKLIRDRLKNQKLPRPSKFYCSRWNSKEFIKGAYSFTSRKTDHLNGWENVLSQPILDESEGKRATNVVMLAGEHCHQQFFSTVHGAFISGIEQADKILKIRSDATKSFQNVSCVSKL